MPSETFNRTDPDADELWAAFSLDELVSDGNPVPYGAKPVKQGPDPLVKHKKALKQPSYKVLTDRYGQQPNLPPVTNRSRLSKLADPMRGKFGNRVLDADNNVQGERGRRRRGRGDPAPEVNDYDDEPSGGGGGGAFFLTGAGDEGEDYDSAMKKRRAAKVRQEKTSYGPGKASVGGQRGARNASRVTGVGRGASTERKPSALEQRASARRLREMERREANKPRAKVKAKTRTKKSMGASGGTQSNRGTRGASLERSGRNVGGRNTRRIPNDLASLRVPESQRVKHIHDRLGPRSKRELNDSLRSEGSRASGGRVSRVAGSSAAGTTKPSRVRNLNKRGAAPADAADISRKQPTMRQSRSSAGVATSRTAGVGSAALGRRGMVSSASAAGSLGTKKPSSVPTNPSARVARGGRVRLKQGIPSQARGTPSNAEVVAGGGAASPRKTPPSSCPPLRPISGNVADANEKTSSPKKATTNVRGTFDSPPRYAPSMRKKETDVAIKAAGVKVDENAFSEMSAIDTGSEKVALKARSVLADAAKLVNADVLRGDLKIIHETVSAASPSKPSVGSPSRIGVDLEGRDGEAGGGTPEDAARRLLAQAQMMTQSGMSVQESISELRRATKDANAKDNDKGVAKTQKQFVGQASRMMSKIQQAEEFSKKYSGLGGSGLDIGLE